MKTETVVEVVIRLILEHEKEDTKDAIYDALAEMDYSFTLPKDVAERITLTDVYLADYEIKQ